MKAVLWILFLALPLAALVAATCDVDINPECLYQDALIKEVADSTGAVYEVDYVNFDEYNGDVGECGVTGGAVPREVDGKYFFTTGTGVEIEADSPGHPSGKWRLIGVKWD